MSPRALSLVPAECCVPLDAPQISDDDATATAAMFKALGDPHRVRIVNLLATSGEPVCVCDIANEIRLTQPTTTFHLKKLAAAGLLHREQRGTWAYYSIDPGAWQRLAGLVPAARKGAIGSAIAGIPRAGAGGGRPRRVARPLRGRREGEKKRAR